MYRAVPGRERQTRSRSHCPESRPRAAPAPRADATAKGKGRQRPKPLTASRGTWGRTQFDERPLRTSNLDDEPPPHLFISVLQFRGSRQCVGSF
jgi:hypothetical protein